MLAVFCRQSRLCASGVLSCCSQAILRPSGRRGRWTCGTIAGGIGRLCRLLCQPSSRRTMREVYPSRSRLNLTLWEREGVSTNAKCNSVCTNNVLISFYRIINRCRGQYWYLLLNTRVDQSTVLVGIRYLYNKFNLTNGWFSRCVRQINPRF